jgi:hypothetical protein
MFIGATKLCWCPVIVNVASTHHFRCGVDAMISM